MRDLAPKAFWVRWSQYRDKEGKPMVEIGGGHFPQEEALQIAAEIKALLQEPQQGELADPE